VRIYGPDGSDRTCNQRLSNWDANLDWRKLRVGYLKADFERKARRATENGQRKNRQRLRRTKEARRNGKATRSGRERGPEYDRKYNDAALAKLREMGVNLVAVEMPKFPVRCHGRNAHCRIGRAAFDELTRSGKDKLLTSQKDFDWPNTFRTARFHSRVEYIQAARARRLVMEAWPKYSNHST